MPIYKVEDYLDKCVESILAQTYKNLEVWLVDDGSPDRCGEMYDEFDVYLAFALRPQTPKNYKEALDERVHLIEVKSFNGMKPKAVLATIKELRQIQKEVMPDMIHLHSSIAGGIGRLAYKSCKAYQLVYTPHGYAHILMGKLGDRKCKQFKLIEEILDRRNCITLTCCESEDEEAKRLTKRTACKPPLYRMAI